MNRDRPPLPTRTLWAVVGLMLILVFNVCWRWHTIGATPLDRVLRGDVVRSSEAEPLDCDEAAYAYIGRRIVHGDVLYQDLSDTKPPLGYWLYTMAIALGGVNELTIRVMPIPFVLATITLVWWIALKLGGPRAACLAAIVFAVADTDPYVFGNGSNMEHIINLFSVASFALIVQHLARTSRLVLLGAGFCLGLATLVKQVAVTHGLLYAIILMWPERPVHEIRDWLARLADVGILVLGFVAPCLICLGILVAQGALQAAYDDVVLFAHALATDVPGDPHAPPKLIRWITGNSDPGGALPWPFGTSTYLVWWGSGLWPLWLASVPATVRLLVGRHADRPRRWLAAWTISAWVQVCLPGLFWQHYYMLAVPGAALTVSLWLVDSLTHLRTRPIRNALIAVSLLVALGWSGRIQVRDYGNRGPNEITSKFKGGQQWVHLREIGRDIGKRSVVWNDPRLFVWGWQSPLFIYSGLDGVSREFFANELLRTHADGIHPIVGPRLEAILRDLRARPPSLILCGYPPFPALREFLNERYLPSRLHRSAPDGRGLWVEQERYGQFETWTERVGK